MMDRWILLIQVASTWAMVGLIWLVQIVHYPLFNRVGASEFARYESDHQNLIVFVVGPMMLLEAVTTFLLLFGRPADGGVDWLPWIGAILLVIIWLSTTFLQVPCHNQLLLGFNEDTYRWLVLSNWIRTIAWTARGLLVLWLVARRMS